MINNTASPVIELIPIATTFVGFNIANIGQGLKAAGVSEKHSPYGILVQAIPFEFLSIALLLITFSSIYFQWKKPSAPMHKLHSPKAHSEAMDMDMTMDNSKPEIKPRLFNYELFEICQPL